jgi:hypothetical protein
MTERSLQAWPVAAVALVVGAAVGAAGPTLRHSLQPWRVGDFRVIDDATAGSGPRAEVPETRFEFGTVGVGSSGSHEFTVRNTGAGPLALSRGATSCSCTVSDFEASEGGEPEARKVVAPGGATRIRVQWRGKGAGGPFHQQATILTDDPRLPEIVFVVEGTVVPTWKAVPDTVVFSRISASAGSQATVDVFTFGKQPPQITTTAIEDAQAAQFLSLASGSLPDAAIAGESGATGGFRLVVDVKPGVPLGPLRATARVVFTMPDEVIAEIPIEGTVGGDLVMAGPGWDSSRQALLLGTVSRSQGLRTRVFLTAKGPHRDRVRPVVKEVVPDSLKVTVGVASPIGAGGAIRIPIDIEIPSGSRVVNHLCSQVGPAGRIVLDTGHPESPELTIPVCVAIGP